MANLPPVGAQATLEGYDLFQREIAQMQKDLEQVGKSAASASKPVESLGSLLSKIPAVARGIASNLSQTNRETREAGKGFGIADIALGGFVANIATQALGAVAELGGRMADLGKDAVLGAARSEELGLAAQFMGQQAGMTAQQVSDLSARLVEAGATDDTASTAITKFAEHNLDAAKAVDLLRVAQGASIITGRGVQEQYDALITSVANMQPRALRSIGIIINQSQANKEYAASIGKTVQALTQEEKGQAFLNAVIREGTPLMGLYAEGMKLPAAQLRELQSTTIPKIMDLIGGPFQDAFGGVTAALTNFANGIMGAVGEGGALHGILVNLGAAAGLFGDALESASVPATSAFTDVISSLASTASSAATDALTWGVNVMTEFADGLITGAADALIAAMDFIGGLLSSWLSTSSPPKVAPDIDAWGADTMAEYLRGFSEADFSALDAVQGPLKSILDLTGEAGQFTGLTMDLTAALSEFERTGAATGGIFQRLSSVGGRYGAELERLARLQFDLAAATKQSAQADEEYAAAQADVERLTEEYGAALEDEQRRAAAPAKAGLVGGYDKGRYRVRAYAAKAEVSAEVAAKRAALDAARARLSAADEARRAAREQEAALQKQIALQDKLLRQLIDLAQAQAKLSKESAKAAAKPEAKKAAKAGGAAAPEVKLGGFNIPKIGSLVNEELDKAKAAISEKLGTLFAPLAERWRTSMAPAIAEVQKSFGRILDILFGEETTKTTGRDKYGDLIQERVRTNLGLFGQLAAAIQPVTDAISKLIPPDILKTIGEFIGVAAVAGGGILGMQFAIGLAVTAVVGLGSALLTFAANPIVLAAAGIAILVVGLEKYGEGLLGASAATATFSQKVEVGFWGMLYNASQTVATMGKIIEFYFWETLNNAATTVATVGKIIEFYFWSTLNNAATTVNTIGLAIQTAFNTFLTTMANFITTIFITALLSLQNLILGTFGGALTWLQNSLLIPIQNAFVSISEKIGLVLSKAQEFGAALVGLAPTLPSWLTPGSETPLEAGLMGVAAATDEADKTFLRTAVTLENELNRVLGGANGTIEDLDNVKKIAGGSMATIGEPLQAAFFIIRDGAAEAGSAVGGVAEGLIEVHSHNGEETHIWVITHTLTIDHGTKEAGGGAAGGPAQSVKGRQHGGWVNAGVYRMHPREYVLSEAMRIGQQAIAASALTPRAVARLAAVQARNGGATARGAYAAGGVTNKSVSVEVNPSYQTVESPAGIYYDVVSALSAARA